ncbi:MAG: O-antigen ligase family protein [Candidatus Limnocylindria bacterium]
MVLLFPFVGLPRDDERGDLPLELSYFYAADVALLALAMLAAPRLVRATWSARGLDLLWPALFALLAIAFAVHPSARGIDVVLRVLGAVALYRVVADLAPERRIRMAMALGLTAVIQSVVAVLQVASGGPLGLRALGELGADLASYGGPPLARGTLGHEFILAGLALVSAVVLGGTGLFARRPAGWLVAAALAVSSAGLIYGRTVALAFALVCASLVRGAARGPRHRLALAALLVGFGVPALLASEGWLPSVARGGTSDRGAMLAQALVIVAEEPVVGVGPGNYLQTLRARPDLHITRQPQHVHNVPVMLAAEAGVPAGLVAAMLLVGVGLRALRAGVPAITLYLALAPFMVLDVLAYVTPQGMVLTALWLGFLRHPDTAAGP